MFLIIKYAVQNSEENGKVRIFSLHSGSPVLQSAT